MIDLVVFVLGVTAGVLATITAAGWHLLRGWKASPAPLPRAEIVSEALLARRVRAWKRDRR